MEEGVGFIERRLWKTSKKSIKIGVPAPIDTFNDSYKLII